MNEADRIARAREIMDRAFHSLGHLAVDMIVQDNWSDEEDLEDLFDRCGSFRISPGRKCVAEVTSRQ